MAPYTTQNLNVAAVLQASGCELIDATLPDMVGVKYNFVNFVFDDHAKCESLYRAYRDGLLNGNIRKFLNARSALKQIVNDLWVEKRGRKPGYDDVVRHMEERDAIDEQKKKEA